MGNNKTSTIFLLLVIGFAFCLLIFGFHTAHAVVPVWVKEFDKCTQYQTALEQFQTDLHTFLTTQKQKAERRAQLRDIIKAREDVNKLVATVYNELRTQQIAFDPGDFLPDFRNVLMSLGISLVERDNSGNPTSTEEMCQASHYVFADVGGVEQCVAVAQEARIITNQDDYIYEESRRRAMDTLFCYMGDWRHFPIAAINDRANCEQLGIEGDPIEIRGNEVTPSCSVEQVWETLGTRLGTTFDDVDGTKTKADTDDDQHVHNLCEGMRRLGLKCSQDMLRDYIKYATIDKITRKDRTVILAPPQTWYTPTRCRIMEAFFPTSFMRLTTPGHDTPYTRNIKSLDLFDPTKSAVDSSFELIRFLFESRYGSPTLGKQPSNMDVSEYAIGKEFQGIAVPENSFSGLASKAQELANQIIEEMTELRRLQYASGEGLRDATLRIGWNDYEWDGNGTFLGKYAALDQPIPPDFDPKKPNKVFKPLGCYWTLDPGTPCSLGNTRIGAPTGRTFYFDTGLVISPISFTKNKIQAAIQAQFDLAQKAFDDSPIEIIPTPKLGDCGASGSLDMTIQKFLPAPWEDEGVNLAATGYVGAPFRIPDLPHNYFNILYNDVFQLYHTPFPEVLERWFRLDGPGFDSIYIL